MLKGYRRQFVVSNMLLTGLGLMVSFIVLGIVMYNNQCSELENTMKMIVKPWSSSSQPSQTIRTKPQPKSSPDVPGADEPKRNERRTSCSSEKKSSPGKNEGFTTIFYDRKNEKISMLSDVTTYNNEFITNVVYEIAEQEADFGTLKDYKIIYYKESTQNEYKITMIDRSYITGRTIKNIVLLFLVFVVSMGIIFLKR